VRGLLKFQFVYFNLFRFIYFKFQNNSQDTTILFSFLSVFPRVIVFLSVHGICTGGMLIERLCEQLHCYQESLDINTTCT
jgi:hypothetical protein